MSVAFGFQGSGQQVGGTVPDLGRLRELAEPEDAERLAKVAFAAAC